MTEWAAVSEGAVPDDLQGEKMSEQTPKPDPDYPNITEERIQKSIDHGGCGHPECSQNGMDMER